MWQDKYSINDIFPNCLLFLLPASNFPIITEHYEKFLNQSQARLFTWIIFHNAVACVSETYLEFLRRRRDMKSFAWELISAKYSSSNSYSTFCMFRNISLLSSARKGEAPLNLDEKWQERESHFTQGKCVCLVSFILTREPRTLVPQSVHFYRKYPCIRQLARSFLNTSYYPNSRSVL